MAEDAQKLLFLVSEYYLFKFENSTDASHYRISFDVLLC